MKHIKFFEELSPDTYIDAGVKIKNKNQIKRGNTLISYGSDLKSNSYYNKK